MIPTPLLAAGLQLLNTAMSGDQKTDEEKVKDVLKYAIDKPFWKSKRFIIGAVTSILLMLNKRLGLDLGMEEITAITGLVSVYIASKSYEQK